MNFIDKYILRESVSVRERLREYEGLGLGLGEIRSADINVRLIGAHSEMAGLSIVRDLDPERVSFLSLMRAKRVLAEADRDNREYGFVGYSSEHSKELRGVYHSLVEGGSSR